MAIKFENLDKKIQVTVKVYYSSAVMLHDACTKYNNLWSDNREKFYQNYFEVKKDFDYWLGVVLNARNNYEDKVLFDEKFNYTLSQSLLKQVDELNVQVPENVKQLVVATIGAKKLSEKRKYNTKLTNIIRQLLDKSL